MLEWIYYYNEKTPQKIMFHREAQKMYHLQAMRTNW